ncbi:hypothetical protein [Synechococcus sp. CBW1004]|uniref:hypothetical protein n=1 Tax=Synechococcus sp. CBW1004 TaxID=1353136 RepID=UPI0018CFD143|nr:hypothetical protein [Synechococcus sp. CBW1004]QPN62238.1 PEP-CTERM sorting domain-containing protein [Synechococcus sp. CBW1004]
MKPSKVTIASFFVASLLSATQAKAALFNYEFMNVDGAVPGTVKGSITLPDGDGTFAASLVTIDSYPAALGLGPTPISISPSDMLSSSFTVGGGQILSSDFFGLINQFTALALNDTSVCGTGVPGVSFLDLFDAIDCGVTGVLDSASSTLSFSPAAASVPGPLPLLGAAAAFAHSRRLRARLRDGSRPQA